MPDNIMALFPDCSPECLWQRVLVAFIVLLAILFVVILVTIHLRLRNNSKQVFEQDTWEVSTSCMPQIRS